MTRPRVTKPLLMDLCGANSYLIGCVHHGLDEVSLAGVYPMLDLDELIGFASSSWKSRSDHPRDFARLLEAGGLYPIFNEVLRIGIPWLRKHKSETIYADPKYQRLNPFNGRDLRARLAEIPQDSVQELITALKEPAMKHVFECEYYRVKAEQGGDNSNLSIMRFQNKFPRRDKISPAYATEIARLMKTYPTAVFEMPVEVAQIPVPLPVQHPIDSDAQGPVFERQKPEDYLRLYEQQLLNGEK